MRCSSAILAYILVRSLKVWIAHVVRNFETKRISQSSQTLPLKKRYLHVPLIHAPIMNVSLPVYSTNLMPLICNMGSSK